MMRHNNQRNHHNDLDFYHQNNMNPFVMNMNNNSGMAPDMIMNNNLSKYNSPTQPFNAWDNNQ